MRKIITLILLFIVLTGITNSIAIDTSLSIEDLRGNSMPKGYIFVQNQNEDGGDIVNGVANFTIKDFPTSVFDVKKREQLTIGPNPVTDYARAWVNSPNGVMSVHDLLGRELDRANVKDGDTDVRFRPNGKFATITYVNDDGKVEVAKMVFPNNKGNEVLIDIMTEYNNLKSVTTDNHEFKLGAIPNANHPFSLVDSVLSIPKGSNSYNGKVVVNRAPVVHNEEYSGESFKDSFSIPLDSLFRYDDANITLDFVNGAGNASVQDGTLIVTDNTEFYLTANDGKHAQATRKLTFDKEQSIFVNAKTISIGKVADERNYNINDNSYIDSRLLGGLQVAITNDDGSFYVQKTSNENGEIPTFEVPEKGSYFYIIESGKTHEAMIKFIVDQEENNEIFSAADLELSVWNALQVHFRYANGNGASELTPRSDGNNRTRNWKTEYLEPGVMNHLIETNVWDEETDQFTDEIITQEQIDTVLNVRKNSLDAVLNNFYNNGNTVIVDKDTRKNYSVEGKTDFFYFKNRISAGTFGAVEKNGIIYNAYIGVNIEYLEQGKEFLERTINQENLSVKGFGELQNAKKPSVLEAGGSSLKITDDDKRSLEWYQIRSQMLADDGVPHKGIWGWDIDQRVFEEANTNHYVQAFINEYGTTEAINEFNKYVSGEKSAQLKSGKDEYKMTIGVIDLEGNVTKKIITQDNFKNALQDEDIPGLYKQEIKSLYE